MREEGIISNRQAVLLIVSTILPTSFMFLPSIMYQEARQDTWISILLVTIFGLAAGPVFASLGSRFPGRTIIQYSETILGRLAGKILAFTYLFFFFYADTFIIRQFGEFLSSVLMLETPISVFIIGIIFTSGYAVYSGLEVLARVNEIILPLVLVLIILIAGMVLPEMDSANFLPLLEKGFLPPLKGAFPAALFFSQSTVMLMFIPFLRAKLHIYEALTSVFSPNGIY